MNVPLKIMVLAFWLILMKPPGPTILSPKRLTLTLHLVDFGERKKSQIEPAAVVEIELIGLVDHRLIVAARARFVAGGRHAADQSLLVGEHDARRWHVPRRPWKQFRSRCRSRDCRSRR